MSREERILDSFMEDPEDPDGCWTWLGRIDKDSYGRYGKKLAHRAVWEILMSPIGEGYDIDHMCNNRLCCNPAHLEVVTHAENIRRRDERKQ